MPVKLNQYWTVIPDTRDQYCKFMLNEFIPSMNKLDIHVAAGWSVLVGSYSEIILELIGNDLYVVEEALKSQKYKDISYNLLSYVRSYKTKILINNNPETDYSPIETKENTLKFTQMWDISSQHREAYKAFVREEFYPQLKEMGINIASEWRVLIGDGPTTICEGRVEEPDKLISILYSDAFCKAKKKLKKYVETYESRLLSVHIQKIKGYKCASYQMLFE